MRGASLKDAGEAGWSHSLRWTIRSCRRELGHAISDDDVPIVFVAKFREIGIRVLDGGSSYILLSTCPWCGRALPASLRDEWFNELKRRGIDDPVTDTIPSEFTDERWYSRGSPKT